MSNTDVLIEILDTSEAVDIDLESVEDVVEDGTVSIIEAVDGGVGTLVGDEIGGTLVGVGLGAILAGVGIGVDIGGILSGVEIDGTLVGDEIGGTLVGDEIGETLVGDEIGGRVVKGETMGMLDETVVGVSGMGLRWSHDVRSDPLGLKKDVSKEVSRPS